MIILFNLKFHLLFGFWYWLLELSDHSFRDDVWETRKRVKTVDTKITTQFWLLAMIMVEISGKKFTNSLQELFVIYYFLK